MHSAKYPGPHLCYPILPHGLRWFTTFVLQTWILQRVNVTGDKRHIMIHTSAFLSYNVNKLCVHFLNNDITLKTLQGYIRN